MYTLIYLQLKIYELKYENGDSLMAGALKKRCGFEGLIKHTSAQIIIRLINNRRLLKKRNH